MMSKTAWIVVEKSLTGTLNQCLGVAQALGIAAEIKDVALNQPWKMLSPYLGFERAETFQTPLTPPWPDLVIAAGRKSVAAARFIKKHSPETLCLFLQNPKVGHKGFDLIAAPIHDGIIGDNVIQTVGAPNAITPETLKAAKVQFSDFEALKSPRVAVLIGGNSKTHTLTSPIMQSLITRLQNLDAGLMITTSRRTGAKNMAMLQSANFKNAYIWDGSGDNPYRAMLAWADHIIVTNDSTSMLCDAATTGKPVHSVELQGGSVKFNRLYKTLQSKDITRPFKGNLEPWSYEPLNDAQMIANAIKKRMTLT